MDWLYLFWEREVLWLCARGTLLSQWCWQKVTTKSGVVVLEGMPPGWFRLCATSYNFRCGWSICIPTPFCGVTGFKPTSCSFRQRQHETKKREQSRNRNTISPMAKLMEDCAAFLKTIWVPKLFDGDCNHNFVCIGCCLCLWLSYFCRHWTDGKDRCWKWGTQHGLPSTVPVTELVFYNISQRTCSCWCDNSTLQDKLC